MPTHHNPDGTHHPVVADGHFAMQLTYPERATRLYVRYRSGKMDWNDFEPMFRKELQDEDFQFALQEIAGMAERGRIVTLLSDEISSKESIRRIIAEECTKLVMGLVVVQEVDPE